MEHSYLVINLATNKKEGGDDIMNNQEICFLGVDKNCKKSHQTRMNTGFLAIGGGHYVDKLGYRSVAFLNFRIGVVIYDDSFFCTLFCGWLLFLLYKFLVLG